MRYFWDLFRWRFVAIYWITYWFLHGAPMEDQPKTTRWGNVKFAWRCWRDLVMYPHEKHRHKSLDEVVAHWKSIGKM